MTTRLILPRSEQRAKVLAQLRDALAQDQRLAGLMLVGSGASGFRDDESDLDLVAPVATGVDAAVVIAEWRQRIPALIPVRYQAETKFTAQHHLLVLLCDALLEIDLSFPSLAALTALSPNWKILWDRTGEVAQKMATPSTQSPDDRTQAYVWALNRAIHRVVYTAKALRRGQLWRALLLLDELRARTVQLVCLDLDGALYADALNADGVERHVDALPPAVLAQFNQTLPASMSVAAVGESLVVCVDLILTHAKVLDQRYGVRQSEPLPALLDIHLKQWTTQVNAETNR